MIYNIKIGNVSKIQLQLIEWIKNEKQNNPNFTVVDVGGSMSGWSHEIVDAIIDVNPIETGLFFKVNLNRYQDWNSVRDYVNEHGKFSFAICSHTLEDIANPMLVLETLPEIANAGYIAVPSKYREMSYIEGNFRGYIHHRWIFDILDKQPYIFVGYPKLSFLEYEKNLHSLAIPSSDVEQLSFQWNSTIEFNIVNNDFLGPTSGHVREYYKRLLG